MDKAEEEKVVLKCNFKNCNYSTPFIKYLLRHKQTHPVESLFHKCNKCEFKTDVKSRLKRHLNDKHNLSHPLVCDVCNKCFKRVSVLLQHHLSHQNNPPLHTCSVCEKNFLQKANLLNHMKVHSNKILFQCEFCTSKFKFIQSLYNHKKIKHSTITKEQSIYCEPCKKSIIGKQSFKRHILSALHLRNINEPHKVEIVNGEKRDCGESISRNVIRENNTMREGNLNKVLVGEIEEEFSVISNHRNNIIDIEQINTKNYTLTSDVPQYLINDQEKVEILINEKESKLLKSDIQNDISIVEGKVDDDIIIIDKEISRDIVTGKNIIESEISKNEKCKGNKNIIIKKLNKKEISSYKNLPNKHMMSLKCNTTIITECLNKCTASKINLSTYSSSSEKFNSLKIDTLKTKNISISNKLKQHKQNYESTANIVNETCTNKERTFISAIDNPLIPSLHCPEDVFDT